METSTPSRIIDLDEILPASAPTAPAAPTAQEDPPSTPAPKLVPYRRLFRYGTAGDRLLLCLGVLCAAAQGAGWPIWSIWFGEAVGKFDPDNIDAVVQEVRDIALKFVYTGILLGLVTSTHVWIFAALSAKQSSRIRLEYIRSLLRQDMAWHDAHPSAALDVRLSTRISKIQEAMSIKLGDFIHQVFEGVIGIVVSFWYSWKLTLVFFALSPVLALSMTFFANVIQKAETTKSKAYEQAGVTSMEILKLIRTVMAFGTYDREEKRYNKDIDLSSKIGRGYGYKLGLSMGLADFSTLLLFAVAFWYGSTLVNSGEISGQDIVIVMFSNMIGFMALGQSLAHLKLFFEGRIAGAEIFEIIDRKSQIDGLSEEGIKPQKLVGTIEFKDVKFAYPANPDNLILKGLSFRAEPGTTIAIVGPSGSGKSTVISLIERFYTPADGRILLDGKPIEEFNIQWLRTHVGLVTQTPHLLPTTIFENIAIGKSGATEEDVVRAAKLAHAHEFISGFPDGYQTNVGDLGGQLSGGQKQRIAIARVLINDPKILLLDEATSALDNSSEKAVQEALDDAKKGRTTIAIAHRLSTIRNADTIIVLRDGVLQESGNHDDLVAQKGLYFQMVERDRASRSHEDNSDPSADAPSGLPESSDANSSTKDHPQSSETTHQSQYEITISSADEDGLENISLGESGTKIDASTQPSSKGKPPSRKATEDRRLSAIEKHLSAEEAKNLELDGVKGTFCWAWKVARPDAFLLGLCFLGSIITGAVWPAMSIILTKSVNEVIGENRAYEVRLWSIGFLIISAVNLAGHWFRASSAYFAGERLTLRLRKRIFHGILHQRAAWFDDENNSSAVLMHRLSEDVTHVREVVGDSTSMLLLVASILFGGVVVAFTACWRTALVMVFTIPVVAAAGIVALKIQHSTGAEEKTTFKSSTALGSEIISNIRLITSLGSSAAKVREYQVAMEEPLRASLRSARKVGIVNFFAQFCNFASFALSFYYSSVVVDDGQCSFEQTFRGLNGIMFCAIIAGMFASQIPDVKRASDATARIMQLLISMQEPGDRPTKDLQFSEPVSKGTIEFKNVHFAYPSRPDAPVLNGLNLVIPAGKTVALVGPSGCGKSTICGLLQKLYEPTSGQILIDGKPIENLPTEDLRAQIGLVDQEPRLFARSVVENIRYSIRDGEQVPEANVLDAARAANVDEFAAVLSDGYDTFCGELGSRLSGGQRQRVAIARALVRADKVKILLLDEATSALDVHNEKLVHDAMEKARQGRTTILIAHRLSTVQSADMIVVVNKGRVVEQGTHDQLLNLGGFYADLYSKHE